MGRNQALGTSKLPSECALLEISSSHPANLVLIPSSGATQSQILDTWREHSWIFPLHKKYPWLFQTLLLIVMISEPFTSLHSSPLSHSTCHYPLQRVGLRINHRTHSPTWSHPLSPTLTQLTSKGQRDLRMIYWKKECRAAATRYRPHLSEAVNFRLLA